MLKIESIVGTKAGLFGLRYELTLAGLCSDCEHVWHININLITVTGVEKKLWVSEQDLSTGVTEYYASKKRTLDKARARVPRGERFIFVCVITLTKLT